MDYVTTLKILVIGESGVGKSSIILAFTTGDYTASFPATIGVDYKCKVMDVNGMKVKLGIWDTAGQERYRTLTSSFYRLTVYSRERLRRAGSNTSKYSSIAPSFSVTAEYSEFLWEYLRVEHAIIQSCMSEPKEWQEMCVGSFCIKSVYAVQSMLTAPDLRLPPFFVVILRWSVYRDAHGAILVYDVSEPKSLSKLNEWVEELQVYSTKRNIVCLVVGNKIDKQNRAVPREQGEAFAQKHRMLFIESSAKTQEGINLAFDELVQKIIETPGLWETGGSNSNIRITNGSDRGQQEQSSCYDYSCSI